MCQIALDAMHAVYTILTFDYVLINTYMNK